MKYSPLSNRESGEQVTEINTSRIQKQYQDLDLDVKRFFLDLNSIQIIKCLDTGYRYYFPFSIIGDGSFYEDLSRVKGTYYSERWEHIEALKFITNGHKVLEIGSGFGIFLKKLYEKNIKSKGIEINPYAVQKCKQEGLNVYLEDIQALCEKDKVSYDVICSFQVLEHIIDVNNFLKCSLKLLKKDGRLIISVPNNNPYLFKYDKYHTLNLPPHHAGLWNEEALISLTKIFPIKLVKLVYEPVQLNYEYFLMVQLNNEPNYVKKISLKIINRIFPKLLKYIICKYEKGRNILVVFEKIR